MIIQSSNLTSSAGRYYSSSQATSKHCTIWDNSTGAVSSQHEVTTEDHTESSGNFESLLGQAKSQNSNSLYEQFRESPKIATSSASLSTQLSELQKMKQRILDHLLNLLNKKNYKKSDSTDYQSFFKNANENDSTAVGSRQSTCYFYQECEMTRFQTTGSVITADGQTIDINISVTMTRSYMEYSETNIEKGAPYLCDPLVINFNGNPADVTDQKFLFDIDCDGTEDSLSRLGANSGFLALDLNEDGIINDGKELFGALSGNGFEDLREYDKDKNGWIDENDSIFQKLKVWSIDENGKSTLISLKEAGVGAISLDSKETPFSINNFNNDVNALVRRTGLFLYENGMTGTIAQLDLAKTQTA